MLQDINSSSNSEKKSYVLSTTVLKAFSVLEYIGYHQPVQPAALIEALGFSRANIYRILATFMEIGYVEKGPEGYSLTFKLFKLGSTVPLSRNLRDVAKPVMLELMKKAEENIYLNVLTEDMVVAIDEVKSSHHLILNPDVTYTYPVHTCASGKVLLAFFPEEQCRKIVERIAMEPRSEHTITDREDFRRALNKAREGGYAMEIQEFSDDLNSMAAPILDYRRYPVATISISGPCMRLTEERMEVLIPALKEAAAQISMRLGRGDES